MQTWQQQRAAFVLDRLDEALSDHASDTANNVRWKEGLRQLSRSLPMTLRTTSLGQTLAMLHKAEAGSADSLVLEWIKRWSPRAGYFDGKGDILRACMDADQRQYLAAQAEVMMLLGWVKLLAVARIPAPLSPADGNNQQEVADAPE